MRLQDLEVFMSIARTRFISEAARVEHLSQPAVTAILSSLEKQLGVVLFQREMRQKKPLEITKEGQIFQRYAEQSLKLYYDMTMELACGQLTPEALTIGSGRSNSVLLVPTLVKKFQEAYPDIPISIKTFADTYIMHKHISAGDCTVGFSTFAPWEPDFEAREIFEDPFVLACPLHTVLPEILSAQQLKKLPFILREEGSNTYDVILNGLNQVGIRPDQLNIVMRARDNAAVKQAVGMGVGCGFVPRSMVCNNLMAYPDCKVAHVKNLSMSRTLFMVRRQEPLTPSLRLFWTFATKTVWYRELFSYDPKKKTL